VCCSTCDPSERRPLEEAVPSLPRNSLPFQSIVHILTNHGDLPLSHPFQVLGEGGLNKVSPFSFSSLEEGQRRLINNRPLPNLEGMCPVPTNPSEPLSAFFLPLATKMVSGFCRLCPGHMLVFAGCNCSSLFPLPSLGANTSAPPFSTIKIIGPLFCDRLPKSKHPPHGPADVIRGSLSYVRVSCHAPLMTPSLPKFPAPPPFRRLFI